MPDVIEIRPCGDLIVDNLHRGTISTQDAFGASLIAGVYFHDGASPTDEIQAEYDNLERDYSDLEDERSELEEKVDAHDETLSDATSALTKIQMGAGDDEALKLAIQEVIDGLK